VKINDFQISFNFWLAAKNLTAGITKNQFSFTFLLHHIDKIVLKYANEKEEAKFELIHSKEDKNNARGTMPV